MPELPDVEGYRRYFARYARGKAVAGVTVPARDMLSEHQPGGARAIAARAAVRVPRPARHRSG